MSWVLGIAATPLVLYLVLSWIGRRRQSPEYRWPERKVPPVTDIMPVLSGLTLAPMYWGNRAEIFHDEAIFAPIVADIAAARQSVHIETFVWWGGELEREVADALIAAARRGVEVRVIVDAFGARRRTDGIFDELREAGVALHLFSPLEIRNLRRWTERTHRKLVIVDGRVGYTMGHGFADEWLPDGERHFRDTGVRLTGPVVHGLQSVFAENWVSGTCELPIGDGVFPLLAPTGDTTMMVVSSTAGEDYSRVELAFTVAIAAARREVLIQNPYFAPDRQIVESLCRAARRGVDISIMVPGEKSDSLLLRRAAWHLHPQLLEAGVDLYEYVPELSHQKVLIVDGMLARVGSTNLDCRSLQWNDEAGVIMLDQGIAGQLRDKFRRDLGRCRQITLEDCRRRGFFRRLCDAGVYLLHGHL